MFNKKDLTYVQGIMMLYAVKKYAGKIAAAREMNVSIDTLNKYIDLLEDTLGTQLLTIADHKAGLTPDGERVLELAKGLKNSLQDVYAVAEKTTDIKGEVKVVYDRNVRSNVYSKGLSDFFKEYPNLSLLIYVYDNIPNLKDFDSDICLTYQLPKGADWSVIATKDLSCSFFASADYLKLNPYPQSLNDILENHRIVIYQDPNKLAETKKWTDKAKKGFCMVNSRYAANDIIVNGGGIGIMPHNFVDVVDNLVCLDNIECNVSQTLYLLSPKAVKDTPKVRTVLNYYKGLVSHL